MRIRKFKLSDNFIEQYKDRQVPWGYNGLGYVVFKRTYSRKLSEFEEGAEGTEEWYQTCRRVIEGMFSIQKNHVQSLGLPWSDAKAQRMAKEAYERLFIMKWTPPGRGLWSMGTEFLETRSGAAAFNCLAGETKVLTRDFGFVPIKDLVGTTQMLLTSTGKWTKAPINSFGIQNLQQINLRDSNGNNKVIFATPEHRWFVRNTSDATVTEIYTQNLKQGMYLQNVYGQGIENTTLSPQGIQHGIVFGDGTLESSHQGSRVALCGEKDKELIQWFPLNTQLPYTNSNGLEQTIIRGLPNHFKAEPNLSESKAYLAGWLAGYIAADGTVNSGSVSISSTKKSNLELVKNVCGIIGLGTSDIRSEKRISNLTNKESILYKITFSKNTFSKKLLLLEEHRNKFVSCLKTKKSNRNWRVISVRDSNRKEEVFCATVPGYGNFVIEGNILTGNCAHISTADIALKGGEIFQWIMDALMLGIGVGFDLQGAGKVVIKQPGTVNHPANYHTEHVYNAANTYTVADNYVCKIADNREGWAESIRVLIDCFIFGYSLPTFDYSGIRAKGEPIKGFGGVASGPQPLIDLHNVLVSLYTEVIGKPLPSTLIVDTENVIGRCVISGNVRRSAAIAFGDANDKEFLTMKNDPTLLQDWRWASNNSANSTAGMDYTWHANQTKTNGEPGYGWLENARHYGRMLDQKKNDDTQIVGPNPCQPGWAKLITPTGIKQLKDLSIGDEIWSGTHWTKIVNKWSTGTKPVYAYRTTAGTFYGTKNHRVLQNGVKVEAQNAVAIDIAPTNEYCDNIAWSNQDIMDGLVIGDGTYHTASNRVLLLIGQNDGDYFNDPDISTLINKRYSSGESDWIVNTTITPDEVPLTYNRRIPERFLYGNKEKVASFLRGLYSANGSVVDGRITLKSTSFQLIEDVSLMLSYLGIRSYYTNNKPKSIKFKNGTYLCRENYDLNITSDRLKFMKAIGFIQKDKQCRIEPHLNKKSTSNKVTYNIKEIEHISTEEVFDITVQSNEHTYATGGLLVSNCGEIFLESHELCNVAEFYPAKHDSFEDILQTVKIVYLYCKTVTLLKTHWPETNAVMQKNRRIGLGQAGIVQAIDKFGYRQIMKWNDDIYRYVQELDRKYSDWLCIPRSKRTTTVKPGGTTPLLNGSTPGLHFPEDEYYIRRIRFADDSELLPPLIAAGYHVEPCIYSPRTMVVSFPIKEEYFNRGKREVSMWEQLNLVADYQGLWADNAVSATVTFKTSEEKDIKYALEKFETKLKGVSFLKYEETGYKQAPYEPITLDLYNQMISTIIPLQAVNLNSAEDALTSNSFCDGDACKIDWTSLKRENSADAESV